MKTETPYPNKEFFKTYEVIDINSLEKIHTEITREQVENLGYSVPCSGKKTVEQKEQGILVKVNFDEQGYNAQKDQYEKEYNEKYNKWRVNLAIEHGIEPDSKLDNVLYSKAYDEGHSSGFNNIASHYSDLAYFAEQIKEAL